MKLLDLPVLSALLATPVLALTAIGGDTPEWSPAPGVVLSREIITRHFLTTESMKTRGKNNETISQRLLDLQTTQTLRTTDELLEVGEGRPQKFRRYYDEVVLSVISETSGGASATRETRLAGKGGVDGHSVVFTWIPEDDEYGRYFDTREGVEENLPALAEDLGMRALLPEGPVEIGASWKVPPGVLNDIFSPGGNMDFDLTKAKDPNINRTIQLGSGAYLCELFGGEEKGTVTATWTGTEEVDGRRLARLELEIDVVLSKNLAAHANRIRTTDEILSGNRVEKALVTLELKGGGVVRWDLDAGYLFDTQDLSADEKITSLLVFAVGTGERVKKREHELVMIGKLTQETRVTVEP